MTLKNNKTILLFTISSITLYFHELYRIFLGCPHVLGDCYIEGAYDYFFVYAISIHTIQVCLLIFAFRIIRRVYYFIKPKSYVIGPCGPIPYDILEYLKFKKKNKNK